MVSHRLTTTTYSISQVDHFIALAESLMTISFPKKWEEKILNASLMAHQIRCHFSNLAQRHSQSRNLLITKNTYTSPGLPLEES